MDTTYLQYIRQPGERDDAKYYRQILQAIAQSTSDAIITIDRRSEIRYVNTAVEDLFGYSASELEGNSLTIIMPDRYHEDHFSGVNTYLETGERTVDWSDVQLYGKHKDGHEIPLSISFSEFTFDGERLFTGIARDITDRKRRERRYEAVFNQTYQFTGLMQPDGTLIEVNETALRFTGDKREDILGTKLWKLPWFESQTPNQIREAVQRATENEFVRREIEVRGAERTAIADFSVRPVTDDHGSIEFLIPEARDITERKDRETYLQISNRIRRHNLRNELSIIRGQAERIGSTASGATAGAVDQILAASDRLLTTAAKERVINELLRERPTPQETDLGKLIQQVTATIETDYPEATVELDAPEHLTITATSHLDQALEEVLRNAVVHNDKNTPKIRIDISDEGGTVLMNVEDNGPGIPQVERAIVTQDRDFDPLHHASGLGLWLVYWVIRYSGGELTLEQNDPYGSTVRMEFQKLTV